MFLKDIFIGFDKFKIMRHTNNNFIIQKYVYNFVLQVCKITLYYKVFIEVQ